MDDINNPTHYTKGSIEPIDFIMSWEMSFLEGNVIKYVTRAPYKNNELKDLEKARFYIEKLIEQAKEK